MQTFMNRRLPNWSELASLSVWGLSALRPCELVIVTDSGEINATEAGRLFVDISLPVAATCRDIASSAILFSGVQGASLRGEDRVHLSSQ